jgi:serine/threonine-protein kinase
VDRASSTGSADPNALGRYRLVAELAQGGMAAVYLAVARGPAGFNKLLVIKEIRREIAEDPEFLTMFLDEARLAARLNHPNVVQTNEIGCDDGRYFIAMEYVDGQPLSRVLHRLRHDGGFPLGCHLRILIEALAGLHHAHELCDYDGVPLEVVHRDATPHNVLVGYDGQVKIVDFGIAKALSSSSETRAGMLKGKVAYMAPEQVLGERLDRRADIFAVGVMLWEAIVGRRLYYGKNDIEIMQQVTGGQIPSPRTIRPGIPARLEAICMTALALRREDRFGSAADLMGSLESFLEEQGDRSTVRSAGKLIAMHFSAERARVKGIVETQLQALTHSATGEYGIAALPMLDPSTRSSRPAPEGRISHLAPVSQHSSTALLSPGVALGTAEHARPPRRMAAAWIAAGSVVAVAAAVGLTARARPGGAAELGNGALAEANGAGSPATPSPGHGVAERGAAEQPSAGDVRVEITVSPASARIFLDDAALVGNPFSGKLRRDAADHQLRIEAPGFTPRTQALSLERDIRLELALERAAVSPSRGHSAPALPKAGGRPKRSVDTSNPYTK